MSLLFGIDIQGIVGGALGPLLLPGTLHVATTAPDGEGGTVRTFPPGSDKPIRGVVDTYSAGYRARFDIPETDARLTVLQAGVGAQPNTDCEITLRGARYRIIAVEQDPAQAQWNMRARPV